MVAMQPRVAVVTGANRGIGYEVARQLAQRGLAVVLTARDTRRGEGAAAELASQGLAVTFHALDVTSDDSAAALALHLRERFGRLDVLVNNAGIALDKWVPALKLDSELLVRTFETNVFGVFRVTRALAPLMREGGYGRVVNLSSNLGSLATMGGLTLAYRASKSALNAMTCVFAAELKGDGILVNAMCPGWVRTELGGSDAPRLPQEAADTALWLASLPADGPTGGFFQDRKPLAW